MRGFFRERLEFYLRDVRGFAYDVVNAVLAADADDVVDALARAEAVSKVRPSADFESISTSFKRMKNILRQASEAGREVAPQVNAALLQEEAEKALAAQVPEAAKRVEALRADRNYETSAAGNWQAAARHRSFLRQGDGDGGRREASRQPAGACCRRC